MLCVICKVDIWIFCDLVCQEVQFLNESRYDESMTGTTHQMVALLAFLWLVIEYPVSLGPGLGTLAVMAVMIGALTPDLDQPTANIWRRMLGGAAVGNIFQAFSGGHRHMTHSLIGIAVIGWLAHWAATHLIHPNFTAQALVIWRMFMIGYISHPLADTLTDLGVPWLWPLRLHFRFPPGPKELRVTTGSIVESLIVRGGIVMAAIFLLTNHWPVMVDFFWP